MLLSAPRLAPVLRRTGALIAVVMAVTLPTLAGAAFADDSDLVLHSSTGGLQL